MVQEVGYLEIYLKFLGINHGVVLAVGHVKILQGNLVEKGDAHPVNAHPCVERFGKDFCGALGQISLYGGVTQGDEASQHYKEEAEDDNQRYFEYPFSKIPVFN